MNDDVGLGRLQRLGGVVLNLQAEPSSQADDVAEIAPDLRGIDVDPADDLESRSRGDLLAMAQPIGPRPKCITRMVGIAANYSPTVGGTIQVAMRPDDHIPAGISRLGGPGAGPPNAAGSGRASPGVRRRRARHARRATPATRSTRDSIRRRGRSPARRRSPGGTSRRRPADDLRFHLYWNAWKNTRSTFMREARALRADRSAEPRTSRGSRSPRSSCCGRLDARARKLRSISRRRSALSRQTTATRTTRR